VLCEVEFLAVGDGSRPGDAIIVRYGDLSAYQLMVVDGGTANCGESLVAHLKKHFGPLVALEHVVLTHSDADHASGLRELLREIPVAHAWLHIPWLLSEYGIHLFKHNGWTKDSLAAAIKKEYDIVAEIVDLAIAQGCQLHYPFQGEQIGPFVVLSPSSTQYLYLLPQFDKTPEPDQQLLETAGLWNRQTFQQPPPCAARKGRRQGPKLGVRIVDGRAPKRRRRHQREQRKQRDPLREPGGGPPHSPDR
jgi:hypothetical protein